MKYIKKPVVVEAFEFGIDEYPEWFKEEDGDVINRVKSGDFIIKESNGEIYQCSKDIFEATYEPFEKDTNVCVS
jgi:hypothetical protein